MPDFTLVKGTRMRLTKLDSCGVPLPGAASRIVTKGFISVGFSPQNEDGNTISQTNANGETCLREEDDAEFQNFAIEAALCGVSPEIVNFMTGQALVLSDDTVPVPVGFDVETGVDLSGVNIAVELWSKVPAQQCVGGVRKFGYFLAAFVRGGTLADLTVQNDAINVTITGARTQDGSGWGVGPYADVDKTSAGAPSALLTPVSARNHLRLITVKGEPPAVTNGSAALGTVASGATAGTPGTFTPANSYAPANLAAMTGKTASPNTAWTTGQYVTLADGSKANWTGTAWAAGVHA